MSWLSFFAALLIGYWLIVGGLAVIFTVDEYKFNRYGNEKWKAIKEVAKGGNFISGLVSLLHLVFLVGWVLSHGAVQ